MCCIKSYVLTFKSLYLALFSPGNLHFSVTLETPGLLIQVSDFVTNFLWQIAAFVTLSTWVRQSIPRFLNVTRYAIVDHQLFAVSFHPNSTENPNAV